MEQDLVKEGVEILYERFGPAKTIKFFQKLGLGRGDTLQEIESITADLSREQALRLVRRADTKE